MEMFLLIVFAALIIVPGKLCSLEGVDDKKKAQIMMTWGAIAGYFSLSTFTFLISGSIPTIIGEIGAFVTAIVEEKHRVDAFLDLLSCIGPIVIGGAIGRATEEITIGALIWRIVRIFIVMIAFFIVFFIVDYFMRNTDQIWAMIALIAIVAGLSIKNPEWILIVFK